MSTPPKTIIKRYRRFTDWDYTRGASLFITIATAGRRRLFGRVVGGKMVLSPLGAAVYDAIGAIAALNPGVLVFGRVVMPDHVHFNVHLEAGLAEPLKALGNAIRRFKNYTTKLAERSSAISTTAGGALAGGALAGGSRAGGALAIGGSLAGGSRAAGALAIGGSLAGGALAGGALAGGQLAGGALAGGVLAIGGVATVGSRSADGQPAGGSLSADGQTVFGQYKLWQQGYHDRLCLTREFIDATERYIAYNPLKWELMYGDGRDSLRIYEPLDSPRLDGGDYWKGVGNVALLNDKLCSLRVSREVRSPRQIAAVVSRLRDAVAKGYTILSGFVSPGERAVCEMLCATPDARFIRILPSCLPNARYKPESRYVAAYAENRYLEIAKGNDEVEFSRRACLDYNAEIVEIACAGEGLALYWKADGPHRLTAIS